MTRLSQTLPLPWRITLAPYLPGRRATRPHTDRQKRLIVVAPPARLHGWILDAICRRIVESTDGEEAEMVPSDADVLPMADAYFFSHVGFFRDALLRHPWIGSRRTLVFFTHPEDKYGLTRELTAFLLRRADVVVSMSRLFVDDLVKDGVPRASITVAPVGADPSSFTPHVRGTGCIGLCSSYRRRKGGERLLEILRAMPDRSFVLCGQQWNTWSGFSHLDAQPNFTYVERPYAEYPAFYHGLDVFLSVSQLEGGPVPLIEAMMSNVVPVASRTGMAPDIIDHGRNGYLFDVDAPVDVVTTLIRHAADLSGDIRASVEHLTWQRFARQIQKLARVA